jgi:hypothetical protein
MIVYANIYHIIIHLCIMNILILLKNHFLFFFYNHIYSFEKNKQNDFLKTIIVVNIVTNSLDLC